MIDDARHVHIKAGTRLGPYAIDHLLGAGGMGEVYRARDTRLDRVVALKVLPPALAADAAHLARFEREAKTISALNHAHICALHDIGQHESTHYLVLELLEGETLAARLARGPLPASQAERFGAQIADALAAAHRTGLVHRDLKPANVMLTATGVKLLDFGLAKSMAAPVAISTVPPTMLGDAPATAEGQIVGTLQYMAPEQVQGLATDARTDIFALGAVLYEMLTGRKAFEATTPAGLIGRILQADPPSITSLAPATPEALAALVERCLAKDPQDRWQSAHDVRLQLEWLQSRASGAIERPAAPAPGRWRAVAIVCALAAAMLAVTAAYLATRGPGEARPAWSTGPIRLTITPPPEVAFYNGDFGIPFAVSPDGRQIAFIASRANGVRELWVRSLDATAARVIPETAGAARSPFWSPDSSWIGFWADSQLKKVPAAGGTPQVVAPWSRIGSARASWSSQDVLLLPSSFLSGLSRVFAQGGSISVVTSPDSTDAGRSDSWPQFLRDGRHFVYATGGKDPSIMVSSIDGAGPHLLKTVPRISPVGYAPGFLLYVEGGALYAVGFDEHKLQLSGQPVRIVDGIPLAGPGRAPFAVSANGVLAYSSHSVGDMAVLQWVDRSGRTGAVAAPPANYTGFTLSPDGRRLALARWAPAGGRDIWLRDLATGSESRVTADADSMMPVWSPRTERVVFASAGTPAGTRPPRLHLLDVDAGARQEALHESDGIEEPESWTPDGASILYTRQSGGGRDLWLLTLDGWRAEALPVNTSFNEWQGRISPDGRWIAYVSDETGKDAVYVAAFPSGRGKRAVSVGGGTSPQWRGDGRELFYVSDAYGMMAVPITIIGTTVGVGQPVELFRINQPADLEGRDDAILYRADSDGQRFLIATKAPAADRPPIHVILNWTALLPE